MFVPPSSEGGGEEGGVDVPYVPLYPRGSWDSDISLRFRFGHHWQVNRLCQALNTRMKTITDSLDIDRISGLDTGDN